MCSLFFLDSMPAGPAGEAEYREAQVQRRNPLPGNILFQHVSPGKGKNLLTSIFGAYGAYPLKENAFSLGLKSCMVWED